MQKFRLRARFVAAAYCKSSCHHQKKNFSHKIVVKSFSVHKVTEYTPRVKFILVHL